MSRDGGWEESQVGESHFFSFQNQPSQSYGSYTVVLELHGLAPNELYSSTTFNKVVG
jgi:hypothetical protein